ncbi:MAG: glutamate mutase L, partial [candidate division Zixibacteria bacterium]
MAKFDNPDDIKVIVATDCGSTTTKAILIEYKDGEYRQTTRGEAPTTVEAPFEDVTMGVLNAVGELEELSGRKFLDENGRFISPCEGTVGTDIYISTSSAGGGLQMMVAGVVRSMTAESAERAALGAGAIVMDVISSNDKRLPHQQIERIRHLRPDMILLSGGIDGGTTTHVVELAELVSAADPKPRLGSGYNLPIIYAGNKDAAGEVEKVLAEKVDLRSVPNLRPVLERENLGPAREEIHELFMEHVMAQAPGYSKLMGWADAPIMPTPGAVGLIIQTIADQYGIEAMGVDIGGATTDVFSVFRPEDKPVFNRTVSANLGMSYSISNVFAEATLPMVMRWVPFEMDERDLRNRVKNKMIRPTTIPQSMEELVFEQGIAREALRLAFEQHKNFATELKGVQQQRTIADAFDQGTSGSTIVNMMSLEMLIGSGGVLSHAPRRQQSALMMVDAFLPEG